MKTIMIREEDDYELQITLPVAEGIIKVVSVIVVYNSKNLIRAFAQQIYPTPPELVKYHINQLYANDFRWLMKKPTMMNDVIAATSALDQVLHANYLLTAHNSPWSSSPTPSEEIGPRDNKC